MYTDIWGEEITTRIHDVCGRHCRGTFWRQISKHDRVSGYVDTITRIERGMMVSRLTTLFMDFGLRQNEPGNREPMKIIGGTGKSYSFQIPLGEYRRGMPYGNGDHSANGTRMEK